MINAYEHRIWKYSRVLLPLLTASKLTATKLAHIYFRPAQVGFQYFNNSSAAKPVKMYNNRQNNFIHPIYITLYGKTYVDTLPSHLQGSAITL